MKILVGPFREMVVLNPKSSGTLMEASRQEGAMLRSVSGNSHSHSCVVLKIRQQAHRVISAKPRVSKWRPNSTTVSALPGTESEVSQLVSVVRSAIRAPAIP